MPKINIVWPLADSKQTTEKHNAARAEYDR
jgi:hypothetical protein